MSVSSGAFAGAKMLAIIWGEENVIDLLCRLVVRFSGMGRPALRTDEAALSLARRAVGLLTAEGVKDSLVAAYGVPWWNTAVCTLFEAVTLDRAELWPCEARRRLEDRLVALERDRAAVVGLTSCKPWISPMVSRLEDHEENPLEDARAALLTAFDVAIADIRQRLDALPKPESAARLSKGLVLVVLESLCRMARPGVHPDVIGQQVNAIGAELFGMTPRAVAVERTGLKARLAAESPLLADLRRRRPWIEKNLLPAVPSRGERIDWEAALRVLQ